VIPSARVKIFVGFSKEMSTCIQTDDYAHSLDFFIGFSTVINREEKAPLSSCF
jgi:hypothetical protein